MVGSRGLLLGCALCAAVAGCADATGGEWGGSVQDSAGVAIVSNPGEGSWTSEDRWTLVEELRIGVGSGDPELQFGLVNGLDVDEEGRIHVLDQQAARIRVFDREGELVRAFGRAGQGPGELSQATGGLFLDPDGNVRVPDLMNQRLSRFTPAGEPLESPSLDFAGGIPLLWASSADRTLFHQARLMNLPGMTAVAEPVDLILAHAADGEVSDTLATLVAGETFSMGGGGMPEIRLFAPETVWGVLSDGRLATGLNSEYSIEIRDGEGTVTTIVRRAFQRRPVTESDRDEFRGAILAAWEDAGMAPAMASQMASAIRFEEEWPALSALLGGPAGTLWVQRVDPEGTFDAADLSDMQSIDLGSPSWDVFDRDGRYLGILEMPEGFTPRRVIGDRLYGVHRDEFGVQRVVRLRIEGAT